MRELWSENSCDVVIVRHNLTNEFQPQDLSVNKAVKAFIQNKYNNWFADQVSVQLQNGTDLKSLHVELSIGTPTLRSKMKR